MAADPSVLVLVPPMRALIAGRGYDGDGFRAEIFKLGAKPIIPNKSNRVTIRRFDKRAYKGRNVIERTFCRLKDFRRIAIRQTRLKLPRRRSHRGAHRLLDQLSLNPSHGLTGNFRLFGRKALSGRLIAPEQVRVIILPPSVQVCVPTSLALRRTKVPV